MNEVDSKPRVLKSEWSERVRCPGAGANVESDIITTMTRNPFYNALAAATYILLVVSFMQYTAGGKPDDSFFVPLAVLSLFTLSAAVMGYIFFYEPFKLYFNGQKEEAVKLFGKTLGVFAFITLALLIMMVIKTK